MDKKLLDILCCPITRQSLLPLSSNRLETLNAGILRAGINQRDGGSLCIPLKQALISADGKWIYRIDDGIPVLLADEAIAAAQLESGAA
jgi:uncharacterized protein YbaR (Trm112 family)